MYLYLYCISCVLLKAELRIHRDFFPSWLFWITKRTKFAGLNGNTMPLWDMHPIGMASCYRRRGGVPYMETNKTSPFSELLYTRSMLVSIFFFFLVKIDWWHVGNSMLVTCSIWHNWWFCKCLKSWSIYTFLPLFFLNRSWWLGVFFLFLCVFVGTVLFLQCFCHALF